MLKAYQEGGVIPEEAQNVLKDRKEQKEREKFEASQKAENEAPRKMMQDTYDKIRNAFSDKKPVKKARGGKICAASSRADGCAIKGKTRGRMV